MTRNKVFLDRICKWLSSFPIGLLVGILIGIIVAQSKMRVKCYYSLDFAAQKEKTNETFPSMQVISESRNGYVS